MRRRTEEDILRPGRIFYQLVNDYSTGVLFNQSQLLRARVEAVDSVGGQLEASPPNPRNSIRARIYTSGIDYNIPSEALNIFHPFLGNSAPPVEVGEHVLIIFEDPQRTSGYWICQIPAFSDLNYGNPDERPTSGSGQTLAQTFEGPSASPQTERRIGTLSEYGGATTRSTSGDRWIIRSMETQDESNPWRGKRVLCIGDSQCAGPFGSRLGRVLISDQHVASYAKDGRVGWGITSWLRGSQTPSSPRLKTIEELKQEHDPDIIVISIGGNDHAASRSSEYESRVRDFFNAAREGVQFVIWSGPATAVGNGATLQAGRNTAGQKIRSVVGDSYVDISGVTNTTVGRARDGVHFLNDSPAIEPWVNLIIQKGVTLGRR